MVSPGRATLEASVERFLTLVISPEQRKVIEEAIGDTIPDEVLAQRPLGERLFVRRTRDDPMTSGKHGAKLYKPTADLLSVGWILSCGPGTGRFLGPVVGSEDPTDYLGRKILFGRFVGGALMADDTDDLFNSPYVCITEADVWSVLA